MVSLTVCCPLCLKISGFMTPHAEESPQLTAPPGFSEVSPRPLQDESSTRGWSWRSRGALKSALTCWVHKLGGSWVPRLQNHSARRKLRTVGCLRKNRMSYWCPARTCHSARVVDDVMLTGRLAAVSATSQRGLNQKPRESSGGYPGTTHQLPALLTHGQGSEALAAKGPW